MRKTNPKVDAFFERLKTWQAEMARLRGLVLDCGLTETLKWGQPCYTLEGDRNIVLIHGFKDYCALLFFKGALMKDPQGLLIQQTENVQAGRQIRFANLREIVEKDNILKGYVFEAIEVEKSGAQLARKTTADFSVPEEFKIRLDADPVLKAAFEALTPGRQRGYLLHFSAAKQSKTRESRIEKFKPKIIEGKGLDD